MKKWLWMIVVIWMVLTPHHATASTASLKKDLAKWQQQVKSYKAQLDRYHKTLRASLVTGEVVMDKPFIILGQALGSKMLDTSYIEILNPNPKLRGLPLYAGTHIYMKSYFTPNGYLVHQFGDLPKAYKTIEKNK